METPLFSQHERLFERNRFVYPVVSRRAEGISIGVNLNPDKVCNFDCIYCQVDRTSTSTTRFVEMDQLLRELRETVQLVISGTLYEHPKFAETPATFRRLNDFAFSGDGEPTTYRNFDEIIENCAAVRSELAPPETKLVLISNASMFHKDYVQRGLEIMDQNNGEIWGKLDAGTEAYFHLVDRTKISFRRILDNLTIAAQTRPIVIQSLFMKIHSVATPLEERLAFCERLNEMQQNGARFKLVQLYTVARKPTESFVHSLDDVDLDSFAELVRTKTGLVVKTYYGHWVDEWSSPTGNKS